MSKNLKAFPRPLGYYPTETGVIYSPAQEGMTLRDYFAAKAMQVFMQDMFTSEQNVDHPDRRLLRERITEESYKFADEMLKQRVKTTLPVTTTE